METTAKERLITFIKHKRLSQRRFEIMCGLANGYVNNIRQSISREKLERISANFPELSELWLLTGKGEMLKTEQPKPDDDYVSLPLIPTYAMMGALTGDDTQYKASDCEFYRVPNLTGATFLIQMQGDSMQPLYNSGDIVACMPVELDRLWFQWGRVYVISTRQGVLTKRIEPDEKEGYILCCSENSRYKPFSLPVSEIHQVALVRGLIRAL